MRRRRRHASSSWGLLPVGSVTSKVHTKVAFFLETSEDGIRHSTRVCNSYTRIQAHIIIQQQIYGRNVNVERRKMDATLREHRTTSLCIYWACCSACFGCVSWLCTWSAESRHTTCGVTVTRALVGDVRMGAAFSVTISCKGGWCVYIGYKCLTALRDVDIWHDFLTHHQKWHKWRNATGTGPRVSYRQRTDALQCTFHWVRYFVYFFMF